MGANNATESIEAMAGFVIWATREVDRGSMSHGKCMGLIAATLTHDLLGLAAQEAAFLPRTNSYRQVWLDDVTGSE